MWTDPELILEENKMKVIFNMKVKLKVWMHKGSKRIARLLGVLLELLGQIHCIIHCLLLLEEET